MWAEQNLLTTYNGDLSGRIEDIDVKWQESDLALVIHKGERALNLAIIETIRREIIQDATGNVGLLQRILEKLCLQANIRQTLEEWRLLTDFSLLERAREDVAQEQQSRYSPFFDVIVRGYRERTLKMYMHILRACMEDASDESLINGLHTTEIFALLSRYQPKARQSDVTSALLRINRLQVDRMNQLIFYYNQFTAKLQLIDRELLFYRKYRLQRWPWEQYDLDINEENEDIEE